MSDDRIIFQFSRIIDKNRAFDGCPWSFDNHILILNDFGRDDNPLLVNLDFCDFHVHIHDFPLSRHTKEMAMDIGNRQRIYIDVDPNEPWGFSLRVRVRLNITKPLLRFLKIRSERGSELRVSFT